MKRLFICLLLVATGECFDSEAEKVSNFQDSE